MLNSVVEESQGKAYPSLINPLEIARKAHEKYLLKKQNEDLLEAVSQYLLTVKINPEICESYYRLALLMLENGEIDLKSAIEQCRYAISLSPNNSNARLYAGYFFELAKDYSGAENEYKKAIQISGLKSARARILLASNMLKQVQNCKINVIGLSKSLYYFISGFALLFFDRTTLKMVYENVKDSLGVISYKTLGSFFESLNIFESSLKVYEKATKKTGHTSLFYSRMGDLLMRKEEYNDALDCYKKSYQNQPNNRNNLLKLATITRAYLPENIDEAIDYYNALLTFGSDQAQIYYELGHLYLKKGDNFHAVIGFKLALDMDSENPYYNNALGFAYLRSNMYDDAVIHYQKAIRLNPEDRWTALVCHTLGLVYSEVKGDFEAAISTFQAGLILDSSNYDLYIAIGDIYMVLDDTDKAIQTYCDAVGVNPQNYIAYSKMGMALWEKNYLEEALVAYHKAIEINPSCDTVHNNLGVVYLEGMNDCSESLKLFQKAIELNSSYTLAYFNTGRALEALGKNEEAASYYQMALDLNRLNPELKESEIQEKICGLFNL